MTLLMCSEALHADKRICEHDTQPESLFFREFRSAGKDSFRQRIP